ncbi:glycosyltransferase family 4 protein [Candidatus Uhrbacteria bacterium]|nr:glycosyltransferase family 4 protein [Candidatus Uhrbacteria bacterium]
MRIIIITQRFYPDSFGGSEHVAAEQARYLARRGHAVTVVTARMKETLPAFEDQGSVRIFRYGAPAELEKFGGQTRTALREVPRVLGEITKLRNYGITSMFDAAILHHPFAAQGFFSAQGGSGSAGKLPALYLFHGSAAKEVELEGLQRALPFFIEPLRPLLARFFVRMASRIERQVLTRSTAVGVFSEFSKQLLYSIAPFTKNRATIIPVGIDQQVFCPADIGEARARLGLSREGNLLLTVRRFSPRMGIIELIRAMEIVRRKLPAVRLLIVGEGPLRASYQKEIARRNLGNTVTLIGAVPLQDLPLYYQAADAFVLPTEALEGLGMATLEALSCGVPVVGTPAGATPEILRKLDMSLITRGTSAPELAEGIMSFLERTPEDKARLRRLAREIVERDYSWEKAIAGLEEVLNNLCTNYESRTNTTNLFDAHS